jgi:hypothetical protein
MSSLFWWLGRDSNSRPRHYELIADARFANALPQFVSDQLPLGPYRRHPIYESLHVVGEIMLTFYGQSIGD